MGNVVFAAGIVTFSVVTRTYRQIASPPGLLSRVMATVRFVSWGAIPVGGLVAGAVAGMLGGRITLLIFVVPAVCIPLVLLASPIRRLRDLTDYRRSGDSTGPPAHRRQLAAEA